MDVARTTLGVLFIGALIVATTWILLPFLTSVLWATTIVVATWSPMLKVEALLRGKRWLAVTVMTVMLLAVIIVPFSLAVSTIVDKMEDIDSIRKSIAAFSLPPPPAWLDRFPLVGPRVEAAWREVAGLSREELAARLAPYAGKVVRWFAAKAGSVLIMFLQFLLTVILSAILYAKGEAAAAGLRGFARRLAGKQGEDALDLSAKAIRGVALGVVLTSMLQAAIGGVGLVITGMPLATVLTAGMFLLCLAQLGPALVLVPSVIWLYWKDGVMWGTVLLIVTAVALTIDNVVRPFLIGKGAGLPLILIFAGVIGGLVAFGVLGLFIGPVILAVSYTLLETWVLGDHAGEEAGEGG